MLDEGVMLHASEDSVVKCCTSIRNGFLSDGETTSTFIVLFSLVPKQLVALIVKENDNSFTEEPDMTPSLKERPLGNIELMQGVPPEKVPSPRTITGEDGEHITLLLYADTVML